MKAEEFKIKVTNRKTRESCIISLDDIFGYEGVEASKANASVVVTTNWTMYSCGQSKA